MSDFSTEPNAPVARVHVAREAAFQKVAVEFIRKVVDAPMWLTAIMHENELTDNARARAKARGLMPGVPDLYVCQQPNRSVWLELKWGTNQPSDAQRIVGMALVTCRIYHGFCWTMRDVFDALRHSGFALHGNADNIAIEYQVRAEAAVERAELTARARATKAPSIGFKKRTKATPAQHARINRARMGSA